MLRILSNGGDKKIGIAVTGITIIFLFFSASFIYSGNSSVLFAFGENDENSIYDITDRPKFEKTPVVCIYEPNELQARDVIIDAWMKKTKSGIESWMHSLRTSGPFDGDGRWDIDIITVSKEKESDFDNSSCRVEVRFTAIPNEDRSHAAGWEYHDGTKSQIKLLYIQLELCEERIDDEDGYALDTYPEFCPTDDFVRSGALGNIAAHEFGHSIGLGHYRSWNPQLNIEWSLDPVSSPSIMTVAAHYNEELNQIKKVDIERVKDIYGSLGFRDYYENLSSSSFASKADEHNSASEIQTKSTQDSLSDIFKRSDNDDDDVTTPPQDKTKEQDDTMPQWIRNNAKWWVDGTINDATFVSGIQHLIKEKIITVVSKDTSYDDGNNSSTDSLAEKDPQIIPSWIKDTTRFWVERQVDDQTFLDALQFLINNKIINIPNDTNTSKESNPASGEGDENVPNLESPSSSGSDLTKQGKPSTTVAESKYQSKVGKFLIYHPVGWQVYEESTATVQFYPPDITKNSFELLAINHSKPESTGIPDIIGKIVKLDPKEKQRLKEQVLSDLTEDLQNDDNLGTQIEIISSSVEFTSNSIIFRAQLNSLLEINDEKIPVKQQLLIQSTNVDDKYTMVIVATHDRFDENMRTYEKSISSFRLK